MNEYLNLKLTSQSETLHILSKFNKLTINHTKNDSYNIRYIIWRPPSLNELTLITRG